MQKVTPTGDVQTPGFEDSSTAFKNTTEDSTLRRLSNRAAGATNDYTGCRGGPGTGLCCSEGFFVAVIETR